MPELRNDQGQWRGRAPDSDAARRHELRVARIAEQLRTRRSTAPLSLLKKAVSHQVPKRGDAKYADERLIEEKLFELGGMKTLISHNYYAEDEFWRTWNRPNYQRAKAVADPNNVFRDLYTKTCRAAQGQAEPR